MEAQHWISTHLPYWNRNGGRDHIIVRASRVWSVRWDEPLLGLTGLERRPAMVHQALRSPASCRPPACPQLQTHDEGSCWLPSVLRPAIVLSHWGRTEVPDHADTG